MNLLFVGDVVLSDKSFTGQKLVTSELQVIFRQYDIIGCNLEGPIPNAERKGIKKAGPVVKNGDLAVKRLDTIGINLLMLANNHIFDYGMAGLCDTLERISVENSNIDVIGASNKKEEVYQYKLYEKEKVTVAVINIVETVNGCKCGNTNGYAYMLDDRIAENIKKAKSEAKYIIIVCHAGAEELEVPLPEIRQLYRHYIDLGVDFVLAHHPHVVQGIEKYKKGLIAYSLGNFAFDDLDNPYKSAYSPKGITIGLHLDYESYSWEIFPIEYKGGIVRLDNFEQFKKCCELLKNSQKYIDLVNEFCIDYYENCYKSYYCQGLGFHNKSVLQRYLMAIKLLIGKKNYFDNSFIYHNVANETNHWICKRANELIEKERIEE